MFFIKGIAETCCFKGREGIVRDLKERECKEGE